jgi:alanine dehydrogenase
MKLLSLSKEDIMPLVEMKEALGFAEEAYRLQGSTKKKNILSNFSPLVAYEVRNLSGPSGFFDFRSGYVQGIPILINTLGFGYPENKSTHGLPGVFAYSILSDVETGSPLAIMEADHLASIRTGTAGAIASKYLARKESRNLAFIGSGHLARNLLDAHMASSFFHIDGVTVWSRSAANRGEFAKYASSKYHLSAKSLETPGEATRGADIICCCSPSKEPRVMLEDLKPGVHINAFGADSSGKQEVDPRVLARSKIVVDDLEQCSIGGEIHKSVQSGLISTNDIYAQIGEIVLGEKKGRTSPEEITLMDATGLAVQDLVIFYNVYKRATEQKKGRWIEL